MLVDDFQEIDKFGRDYLRLTLEINKHVDGYVDAYFGPAALKSEANGTPKKNPARLREDLARLQDNLPSGNSRRTAFLQAMMRAFACTIQLIDGVDMGYLEEVARIYDITPDLVDESIFTSAHRELDILLPGDRAVSERLQSRLRHYQVAADQIPALLELARLETRRRTGRLVDLPDGESLRIELTSDQPWSAYNWYLGNGKSLIEFNSDIARSALTLLATFAHEAYPGHHTESTLKEWHLYRERGYAEQAAMLLHSPAAVISEGIATTALEAIFTGEEAYRWNIDVMLPAANIRPLETADQMLRIADARRDLRAVSGNAAILYHTDRLSHEQTIDYIQTYALTSRARAEKSFSFLSHPLFRSYVFTYHIGYDLIDAAVPRQEKGTFLANLLVSQMLPSELAARGKS